MSAFQQFSGGCAVCLNGTDTALAFVGCLEWKVAGLDALGIPFDTALTMVEAFASDNSPLIVRVCARCVEKSPAPFPAPRLAIPGEEVPAITQPTGV